MAAEAEQEAGVEVEVQVVEPVADAACALRISLGFFVLFLSTAVQWLFDLLPG